MMDEGNPKVMVVSLSKSESAKDYENQAYRLSRQHKKSVKTFLIKIKVLLWALYVRTKESFTLTLVQV